MILKSKLSRWLILGVVAGLAMFSLAKIAETLVQRAGAGAYLVEFRAPNTEGKMGMLANFSKDGLVNATYTTQFGFMPEEAARILAEACHTDKEGAWQEGEFLGPGHGAWKLTRPSAAVRFTVLSQRFDPNGFPIGTLRARGSGKATLGEMVRGRSKLEYFGPSDDPLSGDSVPACMVEAVFTARKIPSSIRVREEQRQ